MKRKSLLFGLLAVLSAVLIFSGCANPADGAAGPQGLGGGQGPEGPKGVATLPSGATPALLAAYFKNADKVFVVAAPVAGNFTVPQGKTLAVVGNVNLSGVTLSINAFEGTIDVSEGKFINATSATFLVKPDVAEAFAEAVPSGIVPEYLSSIPDPVAEIDGPVVLDSLAIGGMDNITAANFLTFAGSSDTVYVLGNAVIDAATAVDLTNPKLVVYGEIQAEGTGPLTIGANVEGSLKATGALKLEGVSNLSELDTGTYTVTVTTEATIELDTLNSASGGKLELLAAVTKVVIGEGNGNIEFNTGAPAFVTAASSFGNTGTTTFKAAASAAISISFAGPVVFEGDLTLTAVPAEFGASASFTAGKILKLTSNASIVTLKPGASLGLNGLQGSQGQILANSSSGNVTLTPATTNGVHLAVTGTTSANRTLTQTFTGGNPHGVVVAGTGTASLVSGATYTVASEDTKVGTLTVNGKLRLGGAQDGAAAAKLVLTGAVAAANGALLKGTGTVVAGATEIVGGSDGWQVGGNGVSTITIAEDTITSDLTAAVLLANDTGSLIKVTAGRLTVTGNIKLVTSNKGKVTLTGDGTTPGSLLLKGHVTIPGKLTVSAESTDVTIGGTTTADNFLLTADTPVPAKNAKVTKADSTAISTADDITVQGANANASGGVVLGNIGGVGAGKDVLITGPVLAANASEIISGWKVSVPNS
jgi:hypothetical protein